MPYYLYRQNLTGVKERKMPLNRRKLLKSAAAFSCSLAASPFITPVSFAATNSDNKLIVIILRGGMDALDVVQPYGDKDFYSYRNKIKIGEQAKAHDLNGFFALNNNLKGLMELWKNEQLAFAHAVATPYRDKRSHFDGQDFLENGGFEKNGNLTKNSDGWLNRMLSLLPDSKLETAFSIGHQRLLILEGMVKTSSWSPDSRLDLSDEAKRLLEQLYEGDELFSSSAKIAFELSEKIKQEKGANRKTKIATLARFCANRLKENTSIAAFSIGGFDTHRNQNANLSKALKELEVAILTLKENLGNIWNRTTILAMSEFGRTVRENGTQGTDHGTGGAMLMAGGAVRGGKIYGSWPGLSENNLYQNRDLLPTSDIRSYSAAAIRDIFKIDNSSLENIVFPNLDMDKNLKFIL